MSILYFIVFLIFTVFAYLLGSINTAIITSRIFGLPDPRLKGSGNPGATNVLRVGGRNAAILTLVGDILKGFIAVFLARIFGVYGFWLGLIAVAVLVGHIFPIFFNFKGGKGVATAFGALLAMAPALALVTAITWLLVLVFSRYSSLAALVSAILMPVFALIFANFRYFIPVLIMSAILIWRHWDNIRRLRTGTESKISL